MRKSLAIGLVLGVALLIVGVTTGAAAQPHVQICLRANQLGPGCFPDRLEFDAGGSVAPKRLPRREPAPIALEAHGEISTTNGGHPSALHEAIVEVDNVHIDVAGLPACPRRQLEGRGVAAARRLCREAIVGSGMAHVGFAIGEGSVVAPLTFFNGGSQNGVTRLFVHSAIAAPESVPVISTVRISRVTKSPYGWSATWRIPKLLDGSASVRDFEFTIERLFFSKGARHSYIAARCVNEELRASVKKVLFRNDARTPGVAAQTVLKGGLAFPCAPRP